MLMANPKKVKDKKIDQLKSEFTQVEKTILKRRSVRIYKKKQVPRFMIKRILEAGRFAPSAGNCQPWKFVVVRDPKIIKDLTDDTVGICKIFKSLIDYRRKGFGWLKPIATAFIRYDKNMLAPAPFGAVSMVADRKLDLYHGAPSVILIFKDVRGVSNPDLDCGIAGQNMALAAHSMGLGTCWVSFIKVAFQYRLKWKKYFNINYPYKFITSLAIGWPVGEPDGMVERQTHDVDWYEDGKKDLVI